MQQYTFYCGQSIKASNTLGHQPTPWPLPYACAQPYHPASGSHGQLFRPRSASSEWHRRRAPNDQKTVCQALFTAEAGVKPVGY